MGGGKKSCSAADVPIGEARTWKEPQKFKIDSDSDDNKGLIESLRSELAEAVAFGHKARNEVSRIDQQNSEIKYRAEELVTEENLRAALAISQMQAEMQYVGQSELANRMRLEQDAEVVKRFVS